MKKAIGVLLVAFMVSTGLFADGTIGENYEPGGMMISLGGNYYNSLDDFSSYSVSTGVDFYVFDKMSFGVGLGYSGNTAGDSNLIVFGGLNYTLLPNPNAPIGFALKMGLSMGYYLDLEWSEGAFIMWPYLTAYYYIAPRIAPYVGLTAVDFRFGDAYADIVETYINVSFGIAFHLPVKDKVLVR